MGSSTLAQGRRPGGHRPRNERRDAAPAAAGPRSRTRTPIMRRIVGDFDPILAQLIDQRALIAFADKYGFRLSKRLIDAEIAQIPQAKGLNGQFSEQAYQHSSPQQRLTDAQVRQIITGELAPALLLTPVAANARVSGRNGDALRVDAARSARGRSRGRPARPRSRPASSRPTPTSSNYYAANRNRYMVPEQRVAAHSRRIGPEQVAGVAASDQEIAAYYKANQATYAAKETRDAEPGRGSRPGDRERDRRARQGGGDARRGGCAGGQQRGGDHRSTDQTRAGLCRRSPATRPRRPSSRPPSGAVVGPVQSEFGWVVVKVDSVKTQGGKSLDAGARRDRRQAHRRQAQGGDRGYRRQGPERDRRRQQFRRGGGRRRSCR